MAKRSRQQSLSHPARKDIAGAVPIQQLKVVIGFPSHDKVDAWFAYDLAELAAFSCANLLASGLTLEFGTTCVVGTYIESARQDLLETAIKENVSHLLWVDADMRFPKDGLLRLMAHNKEIVGTNYSKRGIPPEYTAIKKIGMPSTKLETVHDSTGLEKVEALGFGFVLFDLRLMREKIAAWPKPWFANVWREDVQKLVGEDVYFCERAREDGVKIFVDHDLSKEITHLGVREFETLGVEVWRQLQNGTD